MLRRRAFTLIELLVVVAIIATLIAILIPAMGGTKETANRAACAASLHSQGEMFSMYCMQFNDRLPIIIASGDTSLKHLHDQTPTAGARAGFTDLMLSQPVAAATGGGAGPKIFYCPSNNGNAAAFGTGVLGYAYLNIRGLTADLTQAGNGGNLPNIPATLRTSPPLSYRERWSTNLFAPTTEIALDDIISSAGGDFSAPVPGAGYTNHMRNETYAAGGNVLYFDGHVKFQNLAGPPVSGTPATLGQVSLAMSDGSKSYFPKP